MARLSVWNLTRRYRSLRHGRMVRSAPPSSKATVSTSFPSRSQTGLNPAAIGNSATTLLRHAGHPWRAVLSTKVLQPHETPPHPRSPAGVPSEDAHKATPGTVAGAPEV